MAKNEEGELSQQESYRVFLMTVQSGLMANQRLEELESRMTAAVEEAAVEADPIVEEAPVEEEAPVVESYLWQLSWSGRRGNHLDIHLVSP